MKKKLTFFITSLNSGGAEHQITIHANLMHKEGYKVKMVTFGDNEDFYKLDEGIDRKRLAQGQPSWMKFLAIFNYFLFTKTDCLISYTQRASAFVLWPLLFRPKINVIACERSFTYSKPSAPERLLTGFLYHRANHIVANSFSQRDYLKKVMPRWSNKISTIVNYTDTNQYPFSNLPNNQIRRIGVFARYSNAKNCIRVAKAVKQVVEQDTKPFVIEWHGNFDRIAGKPNPFLDDLRKEIEKLGIADVFHLNDHVKDVVGLMPSFDAILLPSIFEGFSNTISEAICCGKPVLASNVSDNGIMVQEGINGFLFNPLSVEDITNAFVRYLNSSDEECSKMGEQSRIIAEKLFNKEAFLSDYMRLVDNK